MKQTAANIDKETVRWSLSWHPDCRCDSFTRKAILASAPPASGVYGLFNFDYQIFIGESENIQEALLRHESETDFQSRHLQPTGFTFETCAAELRKPKVDELIARYRPVLQAEPALIATCSQSLGSMASEVGRGGQELETNADYKQFPEHEREKRPKVRRHFNFKRTLFAALAAVLVASAGVIYYLGIPTVNNFQKRVNDAGGILLARIPIAQPASAQASNGLRPQNVSSIETAGRLGNQGVEPAPAKSDVLTSASTSDGVVRFAAQSAHLSKKWSVQISAVPAKNIADTVMQRLKANGFDSYVVQAEVNGQTYYRVRVGQLDTREEAESVRQSLARLGGYRDAYLISD